MIYTTQRRRFVYDTWDNGSRLDRVTVECTLSITHCLRLSLQLHTIHLVSTCRISSFCTVACNWQDFNWHDASRGPSAIAELLVFSIDDIMSAANRKLIRQISNNTRCLHPLLPTRKKIIKYLIPSEIVLRIFTPTVKQHHSKTVLSTHFTLYI